MKNSGISKIILKDNCIMIYKFLFIGLSILLLTSCSYTKENYLSDFSSFIKDVTENNANYSANDWTDIDKQYAEYAGEQYEKFKSELTTEEMLTIGKFKGTYAALKIKKGAGELLNQAIEMIDLAKDALDSTVETINK